MKRRTFLTTAALAALAEQVENLRAATAGMKIKLGACDWTMQLAENAGVIYGIESTLKVPVLGKMLDAVGSPNIQVWYDVANMDKEGLVPACWNPSGTFGWVPRKASTLKRGLKKFLKKRLRKASTCGYILG
jgi:hypothetical protein